MSKRRPQSTPQWLQDLKQGRTKGEHPASRETTKPAGMADADSSEEIPPRVDIDDRRSDAMPALYRRANDLPRARGLLWGARARPNAQ